MCLEAAILPRQPGWGSREGLRPPSNTAVTSPNISVEKKFNVVRSKGDYEQLLLLLSYYTHVLFYGCEIQTSCVVTSMPEVMENKHTSVCPEQSILC